jgi:hypothetical protein
MILIKRTSALDLPAGADLAKNQRSWRRSQSLKRALALSAGQSEFSTREAVNFQCGARIGSNILAF